MKRFNPFDQSKPKGPGAQSAPAGEQETQTPPEASKSAAGGAAIVEIAHEQQAALADLQRRLAEAEDKRLRALAELDNARKRFTREVDQTRERERDLVLNAWLEVVDNFERALAAPGDADNPWRQGLEAILQQMMSVLRRFGAEQFGAAGDKFDPALHEAVAAVDDPSQPDGTIAQVALKGYKIGQRILRPAKVIAVKRSSAKK